MKNVILIVNLILFSNIFGMRDQNEEWFEAVRGPNIEKVDQMMKDGINPNIRTRDHPKKTALMIASENKSSNLVEYLIRKNDMNCEDIVNLLTLWKNSGRKLNDQFIQNRFRNMVDINARDSNGKTVLMYACGHFCGHIHSCTSYKSYDSSSCRNPQHNVKCIAEMLIERGADINARDSDDNTVLMYACSRHDSCMLQKLIKGGADVTVRASYRGVGVFYRTALMIAAESNNSIAVRVLLHSADIQIRDIRDAINCVRNKGKSYHWIRSMLSAAEREKQKLNTDSSSLNQRI